MVTSLTPIAFSAKEGQVVGPIESKNGFTIIKPIKIKYGPAPPLSEVRQDIIRQVQSKKANAHFDKWMKKRKDRARITRME